MAHFFKENNFIVSISLDGDEYSHNKNRYNYQKKGSFKDTMRGIEILRKNGIFPPLIATVSQSTYKNGINNFHFFIDNGFTEIKYSPVYDSDTDEFSLNNDMWYKYIKEIFDEWLKLKNQNIKVREIDEILLWFAGKNLNLCSNRGMCLNWISIDEEGNIYPCEYLRLTNPYGNVKIMSLKDVFSTKEYLDFKTKVLNIPDKCTKCELFNLCHNGCPATRIKKGILSFDGLYVYCQQRKLLFEEIKKIIGGDCNVK